MDLTKLDFNYENHPEDTAGNYKDPRKQAVYDAFQKAFADMPPEAQARFTAVVDDFDSVHKIFDKAKK